MMKRALVTGGAGFIGAHLVRALAAHGTPVRVLDNLVAGSPAILSRALGLPDAEVASALGTASGGVVSLTATCEVVIGDIRDAHTVATACAGVDIVFHQAALRSVPRSVADPWTTHDVNVTGTLRVLEAARAAGETAAHEAVLNIGAGKRYTLIDLIDAIERIRGQRVGRIHEGPRAGDIRHTEADISLARRTIGYEPRIDFKAGLRLTIDAMRDAATVDSRS